MNNNDITSIFDTTTPEGVKVFPRFKSEDGLKQPKAWQVNPTESYNWAVQPFGSSPYGICGGNQYAIIDIDNKNKGDADRLMKLLVADGLDINTLTVKTKSGGYHLFYNNPGYRVKTCTNQWHTGVDIRGDGGFVAGPDLTLEYWSPGDYVVVNRVGIIDCSIELPTSKSSSNVTNLPVIVIDGSRREKFEEYLNGKRIEIGIRDEVLFHISAECVARNFSDDECKTVYDKLNIDNLDGSHDFDGFINKVNRERDKIEDVSMNCRNRFIVFHGSDKIKFFDTSPYDGFAGVVLSKESAKVLFRHFVPSHDGNEVHAIDALLVDPKATHAQGTLMKPDKGVKAMTLYEKTFANSYFPTTVLPLPGKIKASNPIIKPYMDVIDNLCDNRKEVAHLYHSQRAWKLQNPLWRPLWGFVIVSTKQGLGKDLCSRVFGTLLGGASKFVHVVNHRALTSGRNQFAGGGYLHVIYNEPDSRADKRVTEAIKELFSESEMSSQGLYKSISDIVPNYYVPEIHSNHTKMAHMTDVDRRYAAIISDNCPLPDAPYRYIAENATDHESDFIRGLYKFYMDYEVSEKVKGSRAPLMPDMERMAVESHTDMIGIETAKELFSGHNGYLASDIQTRVTLGSIIQNSDLGKAFKGMTEINIIQHLCDAGVIAKLTGKGTSGNVSIKTGVTYDYRNEYSNICDRYTTYEIPTNKSAVKIYAIRDVPGWLEKYKESKQRDREGKTITSRREFIQMVRDSYFPDVKGVSRS